MSSCVESVLSLAHAVTRVRLSLLLNLLGLTLQFNCPKQTAPPKPRLFTSGRATYSGCLTHTRSALGKLIYFKLF